MRILHFFKTYLPDSYGGIQQFINQLARGSVDRNHHVDVLYLSQDRSVGEPILVDNHLAHPAPLDFSIASTGFSLSAIRRFRELSSVADIVHYHFPWPFMDVAHFVVRPKAKSVVTYHSDIVRQRQLLKVYQPLMNKFLGSVDRIVATSPNYLATSSVLERYRSKTEVIPIGLDRSSYPVPSAEKLEYWKRAIGPRFFLFVGMLRYYKGLHILLDAMDKDQIPVVILGSGPIESELKEQANRLGLSNVHFVGALPEEDKVALIHLSLAVVFPSHLRSEAFGISLLEGAMFGKAMISSEIGTGTTFVNIHGETGLVVPPSNPDAFKGAMRFLAHNPDEAIKMGHRAQARYEKFFTADGMVSAYCQLYEDLMKDQRQEDDTERKSA